VPEAGSIEDLTTDPLLRDVPEIDGYKVLAPCVLYAKLGQGGMGAVYRGRHSKLNLDVGVKCMLETAGTRNKHFVARFQREARLAAAVTHQNLVRVFDVDQRHGVHFIIMEYVRGETARERVIRKGPLALGEAVTILLAAARGVAAAHEKEIVHRDIKPDNILIATTGEVKLADLGLATTAEAGQGGDTMTLPGQVIGTPRYMPPEQWESLAKVGPPGDVWALGATLYFLLAGKDAFSGPSSEVMHSVCLKAFPDITKKLPDLPEQAVAILRKCTSKDPEERYANAMEVVSELKELVRAHSLTGSLKDESTGSGTVRCTMVSPPPPEVIAKVRTSLELEPGVARGNGDATRVLKAQWVKKLGEKVKSRSVRAVAGIALLLILGIVLLVWQPWGVDVDQIFIDAKVKVAAEEYEAANVAFERLLKLDAAYPGALEALALSRWNLAKSLRSEGELGRAYEEAERSLERKETVETRKLFNDLRYEIQADMEQGFLIEEPKSGAALGLPVTVSGFVTTRQGIKEVRISGEEGPAEYQEGRFLSVMEDLGDGPHTITVELEEEHGIVAQKSVEITVDASPPALVIENPQNDSWTMSPFIVTGTVQDKSVAQVRVNGQQIRVTGGRWEHTLSLPGGGHDIVVEATDKAGHVSTLTRTIRVDTEKPQFELRTPQPDDPILTREAQIEVRFALLDEGELSEVSLNDEGVTAVDRGVYSRSVSLPSDGEYPVTIVARDQAGNTSLEKLRVLRDRTPPRLTMDDPAEEAIFPGPMLVRGTVSDLTKTSVSVNGTEAEVIEGKWEVIVPIALSTEFLRAVAQDAVGNSCEPVVRSLLVKAPTNCSALDGFTHLRDNLQGYCEYRHEGTGIVMVLLPGGGFKMGSPKSDLASHIWEYPLHDVTLDPFLIAKYEVSQAEWQKIMSYRPSKFRGNDLPVEMISWGSCRRFCGKSGLRLPSEAQWEYACRGGTDTLFAFGGRLSMQNANFSAPDPENPLEEALSEGTVPVDSFGPNGFGLYGMHGNVWEWCLDVYDGSFYKKPNGTKKNPMCRSGSDFQVYRGGSWKSDEMNCRSAARARGARSDRGENLGFRPVSVVPKAGGGR